MSYIIDPICKACMRTSRESLPSPSQNLACTNPCEPCRRLRSTYTSYPAKSIVRARGVILTQILRNLLSWGVTYLSEVSWDWVRIDKRAANYAKRSEAQQRMLDVYTVYREFYKS